MLHPLEMWFTNSHSVARSSSVTRSKVSEMSDQRRVSPSQKEKFRISSPSDVLSVFFRFIMLPLKPMVSKKTPNDLETKYILVWTRYACPGFNLVK